MYPPQYKQTMLQYGISSFYPLPAAKSACGPSLFEIQMSDGGWEMWFPCGIWGKRMARRRQVMHYSANPHGR
jgi:hypothetical protein